MNKRALRPQFRATRRALPPGQRAAADKAIAEHIRSLPAFRRAAAVLSYVSIPGDEADTRELLGQLADKGRFVLVPRSLPGGSLSWHRFKGLGRLVKGRHGILEPAPGSPAVTSWPSPAVVLTPGVAFTPEGARLGQGGGYYDRLLSEFTGVSIGLAYSCQIAPSLPQSHHDCPVDYVITEETVYTAST
ncbi:MAG: 5-formyltetrahydrofolate cyclo-ligase [Candidatus Hydrogenedentota bacterium]